MSRTTGLYSQVIPILTVLRSNLASMDGAEGIKQWKGNLLMALKVRTDHIEKDEKYSVSTLLDPR
jgi:hypothetical protein